MENSFYTLKYKTCQCPLWPTKVKIIGKYRLREDGTSYLTLTECELVKNLNFQERSRIKGLNYSDTAIMRTALV